MAVAPDAERPAPLHSYDFAEKLGEGSYGTVYKARHRVTGASYAIKKIRIAFDEEGIPSTTIREISLLKTCENQNIVRLAEVIQSPEELWLVFEHLDMDLRAYMKRFGRFSDLPHLREAQLQCLRGVHFCHSHRILHRDLKPQNVLVDVGNFRLKLADFGLARAFTMPLRPYTHEVVTLWYRAPEILLGASKYATPTDIWSLGCIFAEMSTTRALFPGDSEIDTIFKIFRLLGTPSNADWPGLESLSDWSSKFPRWRDTHFASLKQQAPEIGQQGIDDIAQCLRYYPINRTSALSLQCHRFFRDHKVMDLQQAPVKTHEAAPEPMEVTFRPPARVVATEDSSNRNSDIRGIQKHTAAIDIDPCEGVSAANENTNTAKEDPQDVAPSLEELIESKGDAVEAVDVMNVSTDVEETDVLDNPASLSAEFSKLAVV